MLCCASESVGPVSLSMMSQAACEAAARQTDIALHVRHDMIMSGSPI
jgi:hypothetical protein